jgi:predicted CopG family antitoxin
MIIRTLHIRESAYYALKARKRTGESFSDVILRIAGGGEKNVCDFLRTIDPAVRREIVASVEMAKAELDCCQAL